MSERITKKITIVSATDETERLIRRSFNEARTLLNTHQRNNGSSVEEFYVKYRILYSVTDIGAEMHEVLVLDLQVLREFLNQSKREYETFLAWLYTKVINEIVIFIPRDLAPKYKYDQVHDALTEYPESINVIPELLTVANPPLVSVVGEELRSLLVSVQALRAGQRNDFNKNVLESTGKELESIVELRSDIQYDRQQKLLIRGEKSCKLRRQEQIFFELLIESWQNNRVVPVSEILREIYQSDYGIDPSLDASLKASFRSLKSAFLRKIKDTLEITKTDFQIIPVPVGDKTVESYYLAVYESDT